jgi:hypothetical protein
VTGILLALATVHGSSAVDPVLRRELARVAGQRVIFGHQSVGANVLEGLRVLAARERMAVPVTGIRVAENGDPLRKLRGFEQAMAGEGAGADIALLKFCYADIGPETDVRALFEAYRAAMARLRVAHPGTAFVHVTVPLTDLQRGPRALAKRLLGRPLHGTVENFRREEYNALLRAQYRGREPVFDLARVESTAPDGAAVRVAWEGRLAPALAHEYTDDGGHLNAAGRLRAARELLGVLAGVVRQAQPLVRPDF